MPSIKQSEYNRLRAHEQDLKVAVNAIRSLQDDIEKARMEIRILKSYISGRREV